MGESITIADIELISSGDTMRRAAIGDTTVTVWVTVERQIVEYRCVFKYRGIVEHFKLPLHIHHLDRAFEHACQEVVERQARRAAEDEPGRTLYERMMRHSGPRGYALWEDLPATVRDSYRRRAAEPVTPACVSACADCGVELEDPTGDDDTDVCERCAAFEQMQEGSFS